MPLLRFDLLEDRVLLIRRKAFRLLFIHVDDGNLAISRSVCIRTARLTFGTNDSLATASLGTLINSTEEARLLVAILLVRLVSDSWVNKLVDDLFEHSIAR